MPKQNEVQESDLIRLMQENLALTKEMYLLTQKVKKYMLWVQIIGVLKILLILAPIVIALIYLPPFLQQAFSGYTDALNLDTSQFKAILPGQ